MRLLFLGPPGSGKGTQCQILSQKLGISHLSSGDILRENVANNTQIGQLAKGYMDRGVFVPDEVLIDMFKIKLAKEDVGYILDGFPRNLAQAKSFDQMLLELKQKLDCVINLEMQQEKLTKRITGRRVCSNKACAKVYHIEFNPPQKPDTCDICQSDLFCRSDDKIELVQTRLNTYYEQTEPLIEYYSKQNLLANVNADDEPSLVTKNIINALKNYHSTLFN